MPFFQGARDFDINGGAFYDVAGNQTNHKHDHSIQVSGRNNTTTFSPNLSRSDNRVYNLGQSSANIWGYNPGQYNHGGLPQGNAFPSVDYQEYQQFLAWRQRGSPTAPTSFQPPHITSAVPQHPQIANKGVYDGYTRGSAPPIPSQAYTSAHPGSPSSRPSHRATNPLYEQGSSAYPISPSSYHQPPLSQPGWQNSQSAPPAPSPRPAPQHQRAYSQPALHNANFLSEESEVLAGAPEARFPGEGALAQLAERLDQQAKASNPSNAPEPRPHSTPATVSQSSPRTSTTSIPVPTQNTSTTHAPSSPPPPPNNATKPQPSQSAPSIPVANAVPPPVHIPNLPSQALPHPSSQYHRPSSAHSTSSSSGDSTIPAKKKNKTKHDSATNTNLPVQPTIPAPSNPHAGVSSSSSNIPGPTNGTPVPAGSSSNIAASPFRLENPGPLSPQTTTGSAPNIPAPSTASAPLAPSPGVNAPSTSDPGHTSLPSPLDVFAGLKPLHSGAPDMTPGKTKKNWMQKIGLKKSKKSKLTSGSP